MIIFLLGKTLTSGPVAFEQMLQVSDTFLQKKKKNFDPIQVDTQVPFWMKRNTSGSSRSGIIDFLQSYYDWLSEGYLINNGNVMDLKNLADVSTTPEGLLPAFITSYAPDLIGIYDLPQDQIPSATNIRETINNIRGEIYQKKSTEDAFRSLLTSLFSKDPEQTTFWYPKRKLMRLNGGRLPSMADDDLFGVTGEYSTASGSERYTIVGNYLNQGVLQDGNMWQEFSYIVTTDMDTPYYESVVKETLHPAGFLAIFEAKEVYSEGDYGVETPPDEEVAYIRNYYPYTLGSFETLPRCSGCTGALSKTGWLFPTHVYPTWDVEIAAGPSADFGSIIFDHFWKLNSATGSASPNDIIGMDCVAACGLSGFAAFAWGVIRNFVVYPGVTGVSAGELIRTENNSDFGFNRYLWNFGNGTTSAATNPVFAYATGGTFGISLTAFKDDIGYQSFTGGVTFYVK